MKKQFLLSLLFLSILSFTHAAFLKNVPREVVQPNGDTLRCFASGDEFYNYLHDLNGYTIIQDISTGYYMYALEERGKLLSSSYVAGTVDPASVGLLPFANISPEEWQAKRDAFMMSIPSMPKSLNQTSQQNHGTLNNLVIFIRFQGDNEISHSFSNVENMFNSSTGSSVYNYFVNASYNKLFIASSFYPEPNGNTIISYEDIFPRNYYMPHHPTSNPNGYTEEQRAMREWALLERATNFVKSTIPTDLNLDYNNDGMVDNICYIVKGNVGDWSSLLWPHRWALYGRELYIGSKRVWDYNFILEGASTYFTVSTTCHEMFHTLSAPDLYHYGTGGNLSPVGSWDLMDGNATPPQHSGVYMKMRYGNWINTIPEITEGGTYTLNALGTTTENIAYKIRSENPDQFFLLEYRNKNANYFESGLPGSGLLIYRINTNCNPFEACSGNASYNGVSVWDEVYLFRPNGTISSNGDLNIAHFASNHERTAFNPSTNPYPFLSDGTPSCLDISNVTESGGTTIQFTYNTNYNISSSVSELEFENGVGESKEIIINSDTYWSIDDNTYWYSVNKRSGYGNDTVIITSIAYNTAEETCYDTLLIRGVCASATPVYLSQKGFTFSVDNEVIILPSQSTEHTFTLYAGTSWSLLNNPCSSWLEFSALSGEETTDITITAQENTGDSRTCYLTYVSAGKMLFVDVKQQSPLGINSDIELSQNISIYPNPVTHSLHVINQHTSLSVKNFALYDMLGREMISESSARDEFTIDMKQYSSGIYLLKIFFDDHVIGTYKVVKQ